MYNSYNYMYVLKHAISNIHVWTMLFVCMFIIIIIIIIVIIIIIIIIIITF